MSQKASPPQEMDIACGVQVIDFISKKRYNIVSLYKPEGASESLELARKVIAFYS